MYEIIEKESFSRFSAWYCATIIRVPVFCMLPDGREVFVLNRLTDAVEDSKKNDSYVVGDIEEDKKKVDDFISQLKAHDGKWFDRYSRWLWQPKEIAGKSPLKFIDWVGEKGFTFQRELSQLILTKGNEATFHGNLNEYSCAFCYEIFDADMIKGIQERIPGLEIIKP